MPVDTLVNMCLRACGKSQKRLRDIRGVPYHVARPLLLKKIDNAEQLRSLELKCDQIVGEDGEIWLALIKRDIPNWETKKHEPENPKNWWKVYRKLKQELLSDINAGADELKTALTKMNEKELTVFEPSFKPRTDRPRGPSRQVRIAHGYQSGNTGSRGSSKVGVLEKIKKEAREAKAARDFHEQQTRKRLATTVTRAPAQFVEAVRTQRQNARQSPERATRSPHSTMVIQRPKGTSISLPRAASGPSSRTIAAPPVSRPAVNHQQVQEREARLRALTSGKPLTESKNPFVPPKEPPFQKQPPDQSAERPSTPKSAPGTFSASLLEEPCSPSGRKLLGNGPPRPGPASGGISRSASPQIGPLVRKRKKEPDLFMAPVKKKPLLVNGALR